VVTKYDIEKYRNLLYQALTRQEDKAEILRASQELDAIMVQAMKQSPDLRSLYGYAGDYAP
jgi:hypothetical protein